MLYFEDISEGDEFTAGPYRLTEEEIVSFAKKWDPFDFHNDQEAADSSVLGGLAASGMLTLCIANRLGHDYEKWAIQAMMGSEFRLPAPTRADDELTIKRIVVGTRDSKSRPDAGIVQAEDWLVNQDGAVVLEQKGVLLVRRSPE